MALSLTGFVVFYTVLAIIDVYLLKKYVKLGPIPELTGARPTVGGATIAGVTATS